MTYLSLLAGRIIRFIDDIDMKRLQGRDNLDTFLQEAKSFYSLIPLTS